MEVKGVTLACVETWLAEPPQGFAEQRRYAFAQA
jgi:hypothetical protein